MRILQYGTTSQVARELIRQAANWEVEITALSRAEADLSDPASAARHVAEHQPDLVVLAAAYTAVDLAESEADLARRVNAEAPGTIAGACTASGAALAHFSTDYVFDGRGGAPYRPSDAPAPLNVYGQTKLEGERAILDACPRALVIRTSWVVSAHGKNFVKTMLRLAGEEVPIRVVDDQVGRPTAAADLARFVLSQAGRLFQAKAGDLAFGVHHFANAGEISWCGLAQGLFEIALGERAPMVEAITTAERPAPAARPACGTLDTSETEAVFSVTPRPWREALAEIVDELGRDARASAV